MFESKKFVFLLALVAFSGVMLPRAQAQGNLLVTPRRVVFDGSSRVMELNLANTGRDTARYNISFIQYRMTEEGAFEEITEPDPGQFFADNHLRFFPRSVTLAPNEAQPDGTHAVVGRERLDPVNTAHTYIFAPFPTRWPLARKIPTGIPPR